MKFEGSGWKQGKYKNVFINGVPIRELVKTAIDMMIEKKIEMGIELTAENISCFIIEFIHIEAEESKGITGLISHSQLIKKEIQDKIMDFRKKYIPVEIMNNIDNLDKLKEQYLRDYIHGRDLKFSESDIKAFEKEIKQFIRFPGPNCNYIDMPINDYMKLLKKHNLWVESWNNKI